MLSIQGTTGSDVRYNVRNALSSKTTWQTAGPTGGPQTAV